MRGMRRRGLTEAEKRLARSMFGNAIDLNRVTIHRKAWWLLQPKNVIMAPDGDIWCHPRGTAFRQCFASGSLSWAALFIHEMVHVWQAQQRGRWYLPLSRHPFCRYRYEIRRGKAFGRYGIEQQAEIVKDAFLWRSGAQVPGGAPLAALEAILPFRQAGGA